MKNNDRWSALSMQDRADLIKLYTSFGMTNIKDIRNHYNTSGPIQLDEYDYPADIEPAVVVTDYPREAEVWKQVDASTANIIQRLKEGASRQTIQDWENSDNITTHKMMSADNYAVGNVQNINGQLFDFTDPKHKFENTDRAAIESAIRRGDYVEFETPGDARYFAEHYKKHYNGFGEGGDTNGADEVNQTIPKSEVVNTTNYRQQIETYNRLRQDATEAFNNYDWSKLKTLRDEADALGRELAKYTLNEYSKYTSSPLNYGNWAGTLNAGEPQDVRYLLNSNIREDGKEATEWLKSYVNSDGFQRIRKNQKNWWEARHPYRKYLYFLKEDKRKINNYVDNINDNVDKTHNFVLDGYPEQSFAHPYIGRTFTFKREVGEDEKYPFYETQMHEIDHLFNTPAVHYDTINTEVLDQNTNTKKNHHDEYRDEKHSDNIGVKYLLFKEDIYDARSNKDVTPEQIQQLREKYPELRFLQQLNNEEAAFQINNVAQNTTNKNRLDYVAPENIAAYGGKLNKFEDGGDTNTTLQSKDSLATILKAKTKEDLIAVQQQLADAGYYDQPLQMGKSNTAFDVQDLLIKNNLLSAEERDGNIGENTIRALQTFLVNNNYLPRYTETGYDNIDGMLGNATKNAYNMYLRKSNVDGYYGDRTLNAYYNYLNQNNMPIQKLNDYDLTENEFFNYVNTPTRKNTWASKNFEGWSDEDLQYLYNQLSTTGWDPRAVMYAIDRETNFMPYVPNRTTSAIGLGQLTKAQMETLFKDKEKAKDVYNQYQNKTRAVKDIIDDTMLQYKWMHDRLKSEPENMGYGRIKINLLAPNAKLTDIVPNYVYNGSLTKEQKSKLIPGVSTYRDLMRLYDEEYNTKFAKN